MTRNLLSMTTFLLASVMMLSSTSTTLAAELDNSKIIETVFDTNAVLEISENDTLMSEAAISAEDAVDPAWLLTKKYKVTGNDVNIRTGPGTSYAVVGTLYKGDIINVKSIDNGWAKFKYNGQWRYVSSTYIKAA